MVKIITFPKGYPKRIFFPHKTKERIITNSRGTILSIILGYNESFIYVKDKKEENHYIKLKKLKIT